MKIISELTNQEYDSVEACLEAEALFEAEKEAEAEAAALKKAERKAFEDSVHDAYHNAINAKKTYEQLRDAYVQEYGYYAPPCAIADALDGANTSNTSSATNIVTLEELGDWLRDLFSF